MSIKLEHVVLPSPEQMDFIIEGMRNPMNSWEKSDSFIKGDIDDCSNFCFLGNEDRCGECYLTSEMGIILGQNDHDLMQRLSKAGTDHRKFMRMMPVYVRITAPLYWWKEFDTYKVGTVANSCSTMHKIQEKEFTIEDFSTEHLKKSSLDLLQETIRLLNKYRLDFINPEAEELGVKKDYWWQMIQLLPSSYNQTRNVMMDYEVLANIYKGRRHHKMGEGHWDVFCDWIETIPYAELITGKE